MLDSIGVPGRASRRTCGGLGWVVCVRPLLTISNPVPHILEDNYWNGFLQSCTNNDTLGLRTKLLVFFEDGFVVITMTGKDEYCEEGMYV